MKTFPSKTAVVAAAALFLSSCATKTAARRESRENSTALAATFVEEPAPSPKKPPAAGPASFFSRLLPRKTPRPPAASPVNWAGEIRMVNIAENFVLVESNPAVATIPGEKYATVKLGRETGAVRMTGLRNHPFLIADIISGDPSPGDKIHLPRPTVPSMPTKNRPAP